MWLPLLSACNFLGQFFFSLDVARYVLGSLSNVSSGGIKFEISLWHLVYLNGLFLLSNLTAGIQM